MNDKNKGGEIDVDSILEKLLSVRGSKPGKPVNLTE
jgi:serine/threonine-protein phosphatase PP1 catalytic subunit